MPTETTHTVHSPEQQAHRKSDAKARAQKVTAAIVVSVIVAVVAYLLLKHPAEGAQQSRAGIVGGIGLGIMLAALPFLISLVQATSKNRQRIKLDTLKNTQLESTKYYEMAKRSVGESTCYSLSRQYTVPMITFQVFLLIGCLLFMLATFGYELFRIPNFILGGMQAAEVDGLAAPAELIKYQRGTFIVMTTAFFGSYVYMLYRVLDRINNSDIYPISYYYYAARFVIAVIIAAIFRHAASILGITSNEAVVLIGFFTGFAPDLLIVALGRKAFQSIKVMGGQPDPDERQTPTNMSLFMIEGMSKEKIDRMNEMGIDSSQALAQQNPILLWTRLPYDLILLVNWIGQAQLYLFAKESKVKTLREASISTIFDLHTCVSNSNARPDMSKILGVPESLLDSFKRNLEGDPAIRRMMEVRDALADLSNGSLPAPTADELLKIVRPAPVLQPIPVAIGEIALGHAAAVMPAQTGATAPRGLSPGLNGSAG